MTQAAILAASGSPGTTTGFKNRIINGAMVIDQRNAGASVTPTNGQYTLDRWFASVSQASKFTVQQNAGSLTPVATTGFTNYLGCTSSSAYTIGAGELFLIRQFVEGYNIADLAWGTANAKTVTLSSWVYSSLTGTFGGSINNPSENYNYPFAYTISSANTWTQISVTIAGPTSGTWGSTNSTGLEINFSLGTGTNYSKTPSVWVNSAAFSCTGATSVVGTNGATWYVTGCQLEVGTTATNFDFRSIGTELALCQRYFEVIGGGNNGGADSFYQRSQGTSGQTYAATYSFQVTKRTTATTTKYGTWAVQNCNQPATGGTSATTYYIFVTASATADVYYYANSSSCYVTASAEL